MELQIYPSFEDEFEKSLINKIWWDYKGKNFDFNIFSQVVKEIIYYCIEYRMPSYKKELLIGNIMIKIIEKIWFLFNDWEVRKFFFNNIDKKLYDLNWQEFKIFLWELIWLTQNNRNYVHCYLKINDMATKVNKKAHKISFFDSKNKIIYMFNNDINIIKITKEDISIIENWTDWIIFESNKLAEKWNYIENWRSYDYLLNDLLSSVSYSSDIITNDEYIIILKSYFYLIYFWDLLKNKPILAFIWNKWSGKSFYLETVKKIYTGDFSEGLFAFPSNNRDLKVSLTKNKLCFYDNVDSKINWGAIDLLCQSVNNSGVFGERKLFSNWVEHKEKVDTFVSFTSRTPKYLRDDLVDRSIFIDLKRRWLYSSKWNEVIDFIKMNYSDLMTSLCNNIKEILLKFESYEKNELKLRINDFWDFIYNIHRDKISKEDFLNIIDKIIKIQNKYSTCNDEVFEIIEEILEKWKQHLINQDEYYTAKELHEIFFRFSRTNWHFKYNIRNSHELWIHISNMQKEYITENIEITVSKIKTWNKKRYRIRRIES